jgi:O-antigen/teichoic acid export membrane protein
LIASEVAYFTVSLRTALLTSLIVLAINSIMAPKVAKLNKDGKNDEIKKLAFLSVRLCIIASIPVISFMILYADFLMSLFGEEFINSSHILKILIIGQGINLVTGSIGYILLMTGNESDMRFITLVSGSLLIIFLPIFTSVYGLIGAAWVATLSRAAQSLLPIYFINKRLGFNTLLFWKRF